MKNHKAAASRIEAMARRYGLAVEHHRANTGTVYLTIDSEEDQIKVRFADHQDAYATSDYTVDPCENQIGSVRDWIKVNGDNTEHLSYIALRREAKRIVKEFQNNGWDWVLTDDGRNWYPVADLASEIFRPISPDQVRYCKQQLRERTLNPGG